MYINPSPSTRVQWNLSQEMTFLYGEGERKRERKRENKLRSRDEISERNI